MTEREPAYVLLADAPPLKEGGHGCCVLAWNWLQAMGANVRLVVTHRLMPHLEFPAIAAENPVPVAFYPDAARISGIARFSRVKSLVELVLFCVALRRISKEVKAASAERIFAFFGGDPWFLVKARLLAKRTGLPLDIYLVDDLEESCRLNGQPLAARWARWLEPRVLRTAERVFVISPGYVEHLRAKYSINSAWLPIAFRQEKLEYHPFEPPNPDVRTVAYVGAINTLYLSALKEFLDVVAEWNKTADSFKVKVLFLTYSTPDWVQREFANSSDWEIRYRASTEERNRALEQSWAVFLPYSFDESVRIMVSTSFPSRLSECMAAGRPLLVYGPAYATLPKYFLANDLPVCVQSSAGLKTALRTMDQYDSPEVIAKYQAALNHFHSREAIAERMRDSGTIRRTEQFDSV